MTRGGIHHDVPKRLAERLQQDAIREAKPSRMSHLVTVARDWYPSLQAVVTQQLQKELRTRIGHQILRLQATLPPSQGTSTLLALHTDIYTQLWDMNEAMDALTHKSADHDLILRNFRGVVEGLEGRFATITETLMDGLKESIRSAEKNRAAISTAEVDRFLQARIGISLLARHYLAVSGQREAPVSDPSQSQQVRWGAVTANACLKELVEDAKAEVDQLAQHYYEDIPGVDIFEEKQEVRANYLVPAHFHHVVFEVLKNAYKAHVEVKKKEGRTTPNICVRVFPGEHEHVVRIRDYGNGMTLKTLIKASQWLWSSTQVQQEVPQQSFQPVTEPMTGLGIGIPVSRLHTQHFGGDLKIISIQDWGTDVAIYINNRDMPENIPLRCFE